MKPMSGSTDAAARTSAGCITTRSTRPLRMKHTALLLLAAALAGCTTFDREEIASLRGRGVSTAIVEKLERGHPLAPADVIELRKNRVPDPWVLRQLEDHDVDSLVTRSDVAAMRRAGVTPAIIDAVLKASDRFQDGYRYPPYGSYGWAYEDPWGFYDPYPYAGFGGVGVTIVAPLHVHRRHHGRH
jgi:hypothetical protein